MAYEGTLECYPDNVERYPDTGECHPDMAGTLSRHRFVLPKNTLSVIAMPKNRQFRYVFSPKKRSNWNAIPTPLRSTENHAFCHRYA